MNDRIPSPVPSRLADPLGTFALRRRHLVLAGVCVAGVQVAALSGQWWPTPDIAVYLGLARSIAAGQGYCFNGQIDRTFTPGFPATLAGLRMVFGEGYWAPNAFSVLCGLGALVFIHRAIRLLGGSGWMALAVVLGTGLSYTFHIHSHRILSDVPFALAFWALVYASLRYLAYPSGKRLILLLVLSAAAIALRGPGLLLLGPLALGLVLDRHLIPTPGGTSQAESPPAAKPRFLGRRILPAAVILLAGLSVAGVFYLIISVAGRGEPTYLQRVVRPLVAQPERILPRLGRGLAALPGALSETLTGQEVLPAVVPVLALTCAGLFRLVRAKAYFVSAMLVLYPLGLILCLGSFGVRPRYLLVIQPLILRTLLIGAFWLTDLLVRRLRREPTARLFARVAAGLLAVIVVTNLPRVGGNIFHSVLGLVGHQYHGPHREREMELVELCPALARLCPPGAFVAAEGGDHNIVHYLTGLHTVRLPALRREGDAQRAVRSLRADARVALVLIRAGEPDLSPPSGLRQAMSTDAAFELIRQKRYLLYRRVRPQ